MRLAHIKYSLLVGLLTLPATLFAQTVPPPRGGGTTVPPPVVSRGGGGGGSASLENPLGDASLMDLINSILGVLLVFAVPIIVFFIIFAGFKYVTARGNPGEIETANRALLYAVIGGVLILGARVLLEVISGTIAAIAG